MFIILRNIVNVVESILGGGGTEKVPFFLILHTLFFCLDFFFGCGASFLNIFALSLGYLPPVFAI